MDLKTSRPNDLPDFSTPPVAETVLSLQFQPIEGLTAAHVGLIWQKFRDRLPFIEEQPSLRPVFETFDIPSPTQVEISFEEKPPIPRSWFLNESKTELVQVQSDRFIHNWRKLEGAEPYPRYEPIRDRFRTEVKTLEQCLRDEKLGALSINQCEVTYINHIKPSGVWNSHGQLEAVLQNWAELPTPKFLPQMEDAAVRLRFVMEKDGKRIGRLHVSLQPARKRADNSPIMNMTLTARGEPLGEGIEGAFTFFDLGREWIVRGFADLTTHEMWKAWGRNDA